MAAELATGGHKEISISASAEAVWALVTNIERFGEWSPENYRSEWLTPPPTRAGSRFRGHNRRVDGLKSWWSDCEVLAYDAPSTFAFRVLRVDFGDERGVIELPDTMSTTWRYVVSTGPHRDHESTLHVTFNCPALADPESGYRKNDRYEAIDDGAEQTLRRIKEVAEGKRR